MVDSTALSLALWPCLELLRQYELLRVRSHYEDLCGSLMRKEILRARCLLRKVEATVPQRRELSEELAGSMSSEDLPEFASDLTPKESFNRWLMVCRSVQVEHADPLIPSIRRASNARITWCEEAVEGSPHSDVAEDFLDLASSPNCATDPTRVVNAVSEAGTQMHIKRREQRLNVKKDKGANSIKYLSASAISDRSRLPMETLEREILEDLPVKVSLGSTAAKTRRHLIEYARAVSAIMLAEKQKIKSVSLPALSALVEALLLILRDEQPADLFEPQAQPSGTADSPDENATHLLSLLSSELQQERHVRRFVSAHRNARGGVRARLGQGELQEVETATRYTHIISDEQDLPRKIRRDIESSWKAHASKPPCISEGTEAVQVGQFACSGDEPGTVTTFEDCSNGQFAQTVSSVETLPCTLFAPDPVPQNLHAESYRFAKDGVYHIVCLARPVLTAVYGPKVRALVEQVEEAAQHAAARVAEYAACLAAEGATDGQPSTPCSQVSTVNVARAADAHSLSSEAKAGLGVTLLQRHRVGKDTYTAATAGPTGDPSMIGNDEVDRGEVAMGARVLDPSEAVFHSEEAGCPDTSVSLHHSAVRAVEDEDLFQSFKDWRAVRSCASKNHLVFHNIRWSSCRVHERFMYDGDVEMLAPNKCEPVCTDSFRSFKSIYSLKSYKVVQLWARFIAEKLGHGCITLAEVDCMRMECVCKGSGICGGDWTCSCVRRQIKRIQKSACAGEFTVMIFCLLCRYYSVCGCRRQGKGLHSAAPGEMMQVLKQHMGVECELFASPLNAYLDAYCSLFPDIDRFFGSKGSFFDPNFTIKEGSYEANPPFEETIMRRVVSRIEQWLDGSGEEQSRKGAQSPLSFCLLLPYWRAGPSQYLDTLFRSKYMRCFTVLPEEQHYFLSGFEHFCPTAEVAKISVCKTLFAVLQNEAGARKWPVTSEIIKQVRAAWRPNHTPFAGARKRRDRFEVDGHLT